MAGTLGTGGAEKARQALKGRKKQIESALGGIRPAGRTTRNM